MGKGNGLKNVTIVNTASTLKFARPSGIRISVRITADIATLVFWTSNGINAPFILEHFSTNEPIDGDNETLTKERTKP